MLKKIERQPDSHFQDAKKASELTAKSTKINGNIVKDSIRMLQVLNMT